MADGINLNLGTDGGSLEHSNAKIGNVTGGDSIVTNNYGQEENRNHTITQYLYQKITEHDQKIKDLERAIGGGVLGEEGIVQGLRELRRDALELRRDVQLVKNFDDRLVRIEDLLLVSKSDNSISKSVLVGVIMAVVFSVLVAAFMVFWFQNGGA